MSSGSYSLRWASGLLAGVLLAGLGFLPGVAASAATPESPLKSIVKNADTYVNNLRGYFFCETKTCKAKRSSEKTAAAVGMKDLKAEAKSIESSTVASSQKPTVHKFVLDVTSLENAYQAYDKKSSAESIAQNTGLIYYESANVGSDAYLLSCGVNSAKVSYAPWSVGAVAVLYAMQLDTETLDAKTSSAAVDIYASDNLEAEATALRADANGPSAKFNGLLVTFSKIQLEVSSSEILILQNKKAPLSNAKLSVLTAQLGSTFKEIADLQNTLAKQA